MVRPVAQTATKNRLGPICREVPEPSLQAGAPHSPEPMPLELPPCRHAIDRHASLACRVRGRMQHDIRSPEFYATTESVFFFIGAAVHAAFGPILDGRDVLQFVPRETHKNPQATDWGCRGCKDGILFFPHGGSCSPPSTPEVNRVRVQQPWGWSWYFAHFGHCQMRRLRADRRDRKGQTDCIPSTSIRSRHADALFRCEWGRISRQSYVDGWSNPRLVNQIMSISCRKRLARSRPSFGASDIHIHTSLGIIGCLCRSRVVACLAVVSCARKAIQDPGAS